MIWYSYKHWVPNKDFLTPRFSLAGGLLLVTVAFFTAPAMELVVTVGLALLSGVGMGMFRRHAYRYKDGSKKSFRFDMATALAACCVSIVALGLISPNPWLPSEKIITKSMQPFTGYILSQANGEVAVLTYNPVGVIQLPQSEIKEILACKTSGYILHEATFLELIDTGRDLPYQSCPAKVKVPKAQRGDNTYVNRQDVRHRLAGADDTLIPRG
jgi:hypothetical protein